LWVFVTTLTLAILTAILVVVIRFATNDAIPGWATYALAGTSILSLVSFGNLAILFTVYSQSTAISLDNLESEWDPLRVEPKKR
jgi:hypothetical protein